MGCVTCPPRGVGTCLLWFADDVHSSSHRVCRQTAESMPALFCMSSTLRQAGEQRARVLGGTAKLRKPRRTRICMSIDIYLTSGALLFHSMIYSNARAGYA